MGYDEALERRVRELLSEEPDLTEKRMFGGLAFLVGGKMAVAASSQGGLMIRVDPAEEDTLLAEPHVTPMEMRGRPIAGWLRVAAEAVEGQRELRVWTERGVRVARAVAAEG